MDIGPFLVSPQAAILEAVAVIDANRQGAALVVDAEQRLAGVITDGDIRRAVLAGVDLQQPVLALLELRSKALYPTSIVAPIAMTDAERLELMRLHKIRHLPILDEYGSVVDLVLLDDLLISTMPLTAVIMAGGFGTRLRPLTDDLPKPMLPLDGKPLLERLVEQLRTTGVHRVQLTTHYKRHLIEDYFGNGDDYGVQINYVHEDQPLGTAGALGLLDPPTEPLLVINGDILTRVDFRALFAFHQEHGAVMTVAVREYTSQIPYGVVEGDGVEIRRVVEKPTARYFVNAGIYLIEPAALAMIPRDGSRFDMPDMINTLINSGHRVVSFPIREYWLDIGQLEEYQRAQDDVVSGRY